MARSKSSGRWLKEHFDDPYVQKAQAGGRRSRASFKLEEVQAKDKLIKSGDVVVDLGAAPGGWTELIANWTGSSGRVFALDILTMDSVADVEFLLGDFTEEAVFDRLMQSLNGIRVDVVLSDMAPNLSGNKSVDQPRAMYLCELALDFARQTLNPGGAFFVKVFQGEGFDEFFQALRTDFSVLKTRKPEASRSRSRETYLLAMGFRGSTL
ncbi:23S rRNA (uridine(2552)-2'-O)-methyltransferase RlmE [Litorivicinus sp.]|nr:23S rRNA (uridine(2552)-2'-O)-methyltransferase RlmE [Litorivicinus sp.]MEC8694832.1 23S rRNA (uridine(2552)-2'-O)-methyltransferase RlmE [Pseudomonadota bacterium]MEC9076527.1 23S rRNA (uridine(2552)-2'-O)-methyltransferase RlmE [Pseudomonadota bacterium]